MTIDDDRELQSALARCETSGDTSNDESLVEEIVGRHGQTIDEAARLLRLPRATVVRHAADRTRANRATAAVLPEGPPDEKVPPLVRVRLVDEAQHRRYLVGVLKNLDVALAAENVT